MLWRPPRIDLPLVSALDFASLRFEGDPAHSAGPQDTTPPGRCAGDVVSRPEHLAEFGLVAADDPRLQGDSVSLPCVQSIRTLRRVGPDQSVTFDLVAEVTQKRHVKASGQGPAFTYQGGSTVLIDPRGKVRYVIMKGVGGDERLERSTQFPDERRGPDTWRVSPQGYSPIGEMFRLVHEGRDP